jgi:hypothetical protein
MICISKICISKLSVYRVRLPVAMGMLLICFLTHSASAASKPHIITFGKWTTVPWSSGVTPGMSPTTGASVADDKPLLLKVRPLLVDARIREFTLGPAHDITDRLFVVRRAFRVNDSLPQESGSPPHWLWQRGGWLLVDRTTAHISPLNLPEFDVLYSDTSWYRDYAAYCGVSEDGKKIYAIVGQIGRRKPVLKKLLDGDSPSGKKNDGKTIDGRTVDADETKPYSPDPACAMPAWQRAPIRVTFEHAGAANQTFAIRGHVVDLVTEEEDDEEAAK